ncbi:hypothetical protein MNBD_GAMMA04-1767, partial [hydrothermal vent metagenome]
MIYQLLIRLFSPLIWLLIIRDSLKRQGRGQGELSLLKRGYSGVDFIKQRLGLD